jgi:hypothetical protein
MPEIAAPQQLLQNARLARHVYLDRLAVACHAEAVTLRRIGKSETGNAFGWYHWSKQEAQLYCGLTGSNLAVVALHELTHAVHHMYELKKRGTHRAVRQAQLKGWLGIMSHNPSAWRWLAWVISFPTKATLV